VSDLTESDKVQLGQAAFFPCESKEDLQNWIRCYLGLDLPDCIVDPESTSSPMDFVWEVYNESRKNKPAFSRILAYSCRDGFKTLGASILEALMILHMGRSGAHMAATEIQSKKAQSYVKDFFNKSFLTPFVTVRNDRRLEYLRFFNPELGENLTQAQWEGLPEAVRETYERIYNYIQIVICNTAGSRSEHVPYMSVDEIDVIPTENKKAYEDAKYIPAPWKGKQPITVLTSTREFSWAIVQREIDNAANTGLEVRHWNIIDVTEACPPERHLPAEPKIPIYYSRENLRAIGEVEYENLNDEHKTLYVRDEGYTGCLKNCKLFAVCRGRLATMQKCKSPLLKGIDYVQDKFKEVSVSGAKAQLLCWKPSDTGLIYPNLNREIHALTAAQMWQKITAEECDPNLTKLQLIQLMLERGMRFFAGIDYGFSHNYAVVTGAVDGANAYVLDVIAIAGLELDQKIEHTQRIRPWNPTCFGDPEAPADTKTFKRKGFKMKEWVKYPGSVKAGIEVVRMKLMPAMGNPTLFFLKGDAGVEFLLKMMSKYHFKLNADGTVSEIPAEENDDECDAIRYYIMNVFAPKGKIKSSIESEGMVQTYVDSEYPEVLAAKREQYTEENWMSKIIAENTGEEIPESEQPTTKGKKGSFVWDIS